MAHRGAARQAPENTLAAMRAAARCGYRMVEYDVRLSRDGVPYLLHDNNVVRMTGVSRLADALSWSDLSALDFGAWFHQDYAGEPAPSLYAIARCTQALGLDSNIEIKASPQRARLSGEVIARVAARLWRQAPRPPLLSSFSETVLEAARDAAPELPRALLVDGPVPADWPARLQALGCQALHLHDRHADPVTVQTVRAAGAALAVWGVTSAQRAQTLLDQGCQAVITDDWMALSAPAHCPPLESPRHV